MQFALYSSWGTVPCWGVVVTTTCLLVFDLTLPLFQMKAGILRVRAQSVGLKPLKPLEYEPWNINIPKSIELIHNIYVMVANC